MLWSMPPALANLLLILFHQLMNRETSHTLLGDLATVRRFRGCRIRIVALTVTTIGTILLSILHNNARFTGSAIAIARRSVTGSISPHGMVTGSAIVHGTVTGSAIVHGTVTGSAIVSHGTVTGSAIVSHGTVTSSAIVSHRSVTGGAIVHVAVHGLDRGVVQRVTIPGDFLPHVF